jgi:arginine transport system substrate-binding protein
MRLFLRALLCLLFIGYLSNKASAEDFTIGTTSAYAPYVSLNEQGEYVGFDIDLAHALAKKLNRQLVIKDFGNMPALFLALKQGKVDALLWAISITPDRQKQMNMIYYQGEIVNSLPLLFWQTIPSDVHTIADLSNRPNSTIVVEAGSFQESFLQTLPGLSLKQVDKVMDALLEIKYAKSLATLVDPSLLPTLTKQFPQIQILNVPLPHSQQSFGNGICLNKKNAALSAEVDKAIGELRREGTITELEKKWNLVGK